MSEPKGYPWCGPKRDQMGEYRFTGWDIDFGEMAECPDCGEVHEDGRSLQGKPDPRVVREMERLRDAICPLGWDLQWDMLNVGALLEDGELCDDAIAFVHVFINGTSVGCDLLPTGYGLRVCGDEVLEGRMPGADEYTDEARAAITAADCLEALIHLLPDHVDRLIQHFRAYPNYERSVQ